MGYTIGWLALLLTFLLPAAAPAAPEAPEAPKFYGQVAGGLEEHTVKKGDHFTTLALKKGVQWSVLAKHNGLEKPYRLKAGMVVAINNTHIVPQEINDGLLINLPELMLYHFSEGTYQGRHALAIGKRTWQTPTGNYRIRNKVRNPTWVVPPSIQEEMEEMGYEVLEKVPPGPKNPLGAFWIGTSAPGVGIHATNRPWSIGYSVSHGCIRMLPEEIEGLFEQVAVGQAVKITYRPVKLALTPQGRIYLEANPNVYRRKLDYLEMVRELARREQLEDRLNWVRVKEILKAREGIAQDVALEPVPKTLMSPHPPESQETRLTPLQEQSTKLE